MTDTELPFDQVGRARHRDPDTAKAAAAANHVERKLQWKALLARLADGPISADTAGLVIGRHRSTASSRLGGLVAKGLAEHAGNVWEAPPEGGRERWVLRYRLTPEGRREWALMFSGIVR